MAIYLHSTISTKYLCALTTENEQSNIMKKSLFKASLKYNTKLLLKTVNIAPERT